MPEEYYEIEIERNMLEKAMRLNITYGAGVQWAEDYAAEHKKFQLTFSIFGRYCFLIIFPFA